ncbi:hypothetical protein [Nocardia sp. NPDC057455]|uniref:hypothetical protein n=1 Tax=Nocardia sp. NPDC057455 TaxID=3346138 RepID=UPI00366BC31D
MSSGQLPRWPEFFPRMKYRARKRHGRKMRIIYWDKDLNPVWPQPDFGGLNVVVYDEAMQWSGVEDEAA